MFELGWLELILIGITALIVVGPKDLPGLFRNVGRFMGRMRAMAREFQRSMEQAADESGLKEATSGLKDLHDLKRSPTKTARNYARDMMKGDDDAKAKDAEAMADEVAYAAERDPVPTPTPKPAQDTTTDDPMPVADPAPATEPRQNRES